MYIQAGLWMVLHITIHNKLKKNQVSLKYREKSET